MLSKKYNNVFSWKSKLETLNSLPATFATDKDAMWNKLNDRLQQKQTNPKVVWYWAAAATLPLIIITLTMLKNTSTVLVQQATPTKINKTAAPVFLQPASKEDLSFSVLPPTQKRQMAAGIKVNTKSEIFRDTVNAKETIVFTTLPENPKTEIEIISLQKVDTGLTIPATAIAKNKLRVIHINELETFPAEFTAPVNYAQNLVEIKIKKNKTHNVSIARQQNSIGFKIKLSSKN